jgi:hypothetical protein
MKNTARSLATIALVLFGFGCVEESPDLTEAEQAALAEYILHEAPTPQHPLDIRFESRVRLVGYDIDVEEITPGQAFHVVWYWQVERRLGAGWQLFTHVADGAGANRQNEDSNGVVRERYAPSRWREGEWVRDPQTITLPHSGDPAWNSDRAVIYLGFWHDDHRLSVTSGPNDGENRARAASIPVSGGPSSDATGTTTPTGATPAIPQLAATHATGAIQIDGQLTEADWTHAHATSAFVDTRSGGAGSFPATARVLWDEQNLYVGFDVTDDYLHNTIAARDGHLWEQDAVEIMIDPDGDGQHYFELQVSPTGNVFETAYDSRRVPQPIGHDDWDSHMVTRAVAHGTPNDTEADTGYAVELSVPWTALAYGDMPAAAAPPAGSQWRFNFYVMDTRQDDSQRAVGWSPTLEGDFHVPARFGRVQFEGAAAVADPTAPPLMLAPAVAARIRPLVPEPVLLPRGSTAPTLPAHP